MMRHFLNIIEILTRLSSRWIFSYKSICIVLCLCSALSLFQTVKASSSPIFSTGNTITTLEGMSKPNWNGKSLTFNNGQAILTLTPLSDDVVRVHLTKANSRTSDHSYAVITQNLGETHPQIEVGLNSTTLITNSLKVTVHHNPLRISFSNSDGKILDSDADPGISYTGNAFRVSKRLHSDEHVYGLGEKNGKLDKRGWQLGGYNYTMWNLDTFAYDSSTDPLYVSVPFYMVLRNGKAHGIFLDNTYRSTFDIGHEQEHLLSFGSNGGDLNYYFINGPHPKQVIERYTALTGRTPLPPLWSLGFHQCRYSYYPESRVRLLANTFREKKVPADTLWLDIHYQDNYKPFTWDHEHFPDPKKMIADLRSQGFHLVCILDGHPKVEPGYVPYDTGIEGDHFVKNPDGTVYTAPVWPSKAEHNPGLSVFPDFSRSMTREWWGNLLKSFIDIGVAGIWNDMNEPSVFIGPTGTFPLDLIHDNDGRPTNHAEIHNVYGQLMTRATFEGLSRLRPNERPFVLTRASFAGGQRYSAVWSGDNTADWTSLRQSVVTLLGMGISGFPFIGSDISGFVRSASGELYIRWLQAGIFYPFMRSHTQFGTPDKEPWSFGSRMETISKRAIELRYQLLPYIYNVMQQASETGLPAMRPLFMEFPDDENVASMDDEFFFGSDLLVAPVLWEGTTTREVYLPKGDWYDYWTGRKFTGSSFIEREVTLDTIPLFVRSGAFIFRQPVVQNTSEMPGKPLRVLITPAKESESILYEDDGLTLKYLKGSFLKRRFHQLRNNSELVIEILHLEGNYRPDTRDLILEMLTDLKPKSISIQIGNEIKTLPLLDNSMFAKSAFGWSYGNNMLVVKDQDRFQSVRFIIHFGTEDLHINAADPEL